MKYEILKTKKWVNQIGCYPSRIVLLKIKKSNDLTEYSTHIQCDASKDKAKFKKSNLDTLYLILGHYFTNILDAEKDFKTREV